MDQISLKAYAKINLALDVIGKREDGYHDLISVMQMVTLHDQIFIKKIDKPHIKVITNISWLPVNEKNLVYKAAALLIERFHIKQGVFIQLTKNIPICAGLGGGSSDCAATLVGMRNLFDLPLSTQDLMAIGKTLGADVPYCIARGTVLAEGIGERLTPLGHHPQVYVLLVKPSISISTATVFKSLSLDKIRSRPDFPSLIHHIKKQNVHGIAENFCNVLENVTENNFPIITQIKQSMDAHGALGTLMSGSGPTVFGYFSTKKSAQEAISEISSLVPLTQMHLSKIFNPR